MATPIDRAAIETAVRTALKAAPIMDMHTHVYAPEFGGLLLWGIDELLTYHYLVAEFFRVAEPETDYDSFWSLPKTRQAEVIWEDLFIRRSPLSEACRGVITCLRMLGLDPAERDLNKLRRYFRETSLEQHLEQVLSRSHVRSLIMTNNPFDEQERPFWLSGSGYDGRFRPALRLDQLLVRWSQGAPVLVELGYNVQSPTSQTTVTQVRRFLDDWIARMRPLYLAASLPPEFRYPDASIASLMLEKCVLPAALDHDLPFALMIGCRPQVNPKLRLAGDAVGAADLTAVTNLCTAFPRNRFLGTLLSRENQHELAVLARKFRNLHIFGCWWFLNTPSLIDEITRLRLELLGLSFTPQHSDARVLEQLLYKWEHSREVLARVLTDKYADLATAGRPATAAEMQRDVGDLLGGEALRFIGGKAK
jgi:hypothetical protein